jgi:ABC-type oligopeptide transport system ATPase subunit
MLFKIFHLRPKQDYCFVGPSGSGKTTGKMLVGLYKPAEGAIYYIMIKNMI